MKIVIEDGVPAVKLTNGEKRAMDTTREICIQAAKFLGDELAKTVETDIGILTERYVTADKSATDQSHEQAEPAAA